MKPAEWRRAMALLGAAALTAACASERVVLVRHEGQVRGATFTVIPAYYNPLEMAFAGKVEKEIAAHGLVVLERPPFKFKETTKGSRGETGEDGQDGERKESTVDVVAMHEDSSTSHIIVTYQTSGRIRFIRKSDKALVATAVVRSTKLSRIAKEVHSLLLYGGFLKEEHEPGNCKFVEP